MFSAVVAGIAILSVILAINSLKKLNQKEEIEEARQKLKKGKVIFQSEKSSAGV